MFFRVRNDDAKAVAAFAVAVAAAFLAGWLPLGFSIVTVFLLAGPHNWIEARYFLARMPARWGRLRGFFLFAFAGIFGLTAAFAALVILQDRLDWSADAWFHANVFSFLAGEWMNSVGWPFIR